MKKIVLLAALLLLSCAKHKDLPNAINVNEPYKPVNFVVTMCPDGNYTLDWSVPDSTSVDYYRVFIIDPFTGPEELDTTSVSNFAIDFRPLAVTGIIWGVSVVSVDKIEGRMASAVATRFCDEAQ